MQDKTRAVSDKRIMIALSVLTFLTPLIVNLVVSVLSGNGIGILKTAPFNSDEISWHLQTAASVKYDIPKGYFGYNGSKAALGTFGAWGFVPFPPYVLICKLFGMYLWSRHIINLFFLGLALLLFSLMTELNAKQIILLDLTYLLMPVTVRYSVSAMNEGERYALAIILCGLLIRTVKKGMGKLQTFLIVPVIILYAVLSYDIFILFVPVYVYFVLKDKKPALRVVASLSVTVAVLIVCRIVNGLTCAEYTFPGNPDVMGVLMDKMNDGFITGIKAVVYMMFRNMARFGPNNLINIFEREHGIYSVYLGMYVIICALLLISCIYRFTKKKDMTYTLVSMWFVWGYAFAFGALYTDDEVTLTRGINCGLIVLLLILVANCDKRKLYVYFIAILAVTPFSWGYIKDVVNDSAGAYGKLPVIESESGRLSDIMKLSDDRWENTAAFYGDMDINVLEIPSGFGINYYLDGVWDTKTGWIVINGKDHDTDGVPEAYEKAYENDDLMIYKKAGSKL